MAHCKECANSIFIEKWGEFKCKVSKRIVYAPNYQADMCDSFKKGITSDSVLNEFYEDLLDD